MKKLLLLLTVITFCLISYAQKIQKIDPVLQEEMQMRNQDELIPINIIMKAQYDQLILRSKANIYRKKEEKRAFVVNELKNHSKETQQEVMSYLNHFERSESVSNITQFWIFNGITCSATQEVIEALSYLDDILIIGFDQEHQCIPEYGDSNSDGGTREITYNVLKVNANLVWNELGYTGEGIIVGVIDTGVNYNHNDLKTHLWEHPDYPNHGWNFVNNGNNPMDDHGHGTHCAGTVAGDGTSGSQTGMAPNAKIMALKVWDSGGSGTSTQMCSGFQFGVEHGAHVLSMSGGVYGGGSEAERIQFRNTMINVLEAGIIASIAAGNEGPGSSYYVPPPNSVRVPGNCPPPWLHPDQTTTGGISAVVSVGATDINDNIAGFSSRGPCTWQSIAGYNDYPYNPGMGLIRPDVCAPGVNIKSLAYNNVSGYADDWSGTSMACPCVSGVMALMLEKNPEITPAEICEILENTAVKLSTTKNNIYGSGRVNAFDAVDAVPVGPIAFYEVFVDDSEGNNNGNANPGETIKLDVSLINESTLDVYGVSVTITSSNEYVTITNNLADFGDFSADEIKTLTNAFTFELSSLAPAKQKIIFDAEITTSDDLFVKKFTLTTFDYALKLTGTAIADGGGNGILDPGETADIVTTLTNNGNESVLGLTGFLTSNSSDITINNNIADYGDIDIDEAISAPFSITLSNVAVPGNVSIPFNLLATDENGRKSTFSFVYKDNCAIKFDLHDSYGDGWSGNQLVVTFSDGSPTQNLTIYGNNSFATYTFEVNSGTNVKLSWITGSWVEECSFEVFYVDGDIIYSASGYPGSGIFFNWDVNCTKSVNCAQIKDLSVDINNYIAELNWNAPTSGTPNNYEIYYNLESVGNTTSTNFSIPLNGTDHEFCVYAVFDNCLIPECISISNCDTVTDLYSSVNGYAVTLSWSAPSLGSEVLHYYIYRDDELVGTVETESFEEEVPSGLYVYSIETEYISECISDRVSIEVLVFVLILETPTNLTAIPNTDDFTIELSWECEDESLLFNIYRDDEKIASNINEMQYTDTAVVVNVEYCYYVKSTNEEIESDASNEACTLIFYDKVATYNGNLKIYPNPSNSIINVEGMNIEKVTVINSVGQIVKTVLFTNTGIPIDVSHFAVGNYVFSVSYSDGSIENVKVVIK